MIKWSLAILALTVVLGIYSLNATAVFPKILFFSSVVVLYLSLLGKRKVA
jgi:hypothetical protein